MKQTQEKRTFRRYKYLKLYEYFGHGLILQQVLCSAFFSAPILTLQNGRLIESNTPNTKT